MFYWCKIVPQRDTDENNKYKIAIKVNKKVKYAMALYQKCVTRSTS